MELSDLTRERTTLLPTLFKFSHTQPEDQSQQTATCRLHRIRSCVGRSLTAYLLCKHVWSPLVLEQLNSFII